MLFFQNVFLFLFDLMRLLQHIESSYYLFYWLDLLLLFCFLSNQENLFMIHHDLDLFWDIYNIINEHKDKLINFHLFFQIILISILELKKFFYNFISFVINQDFYIITFWMHCTLFIIFFGRSKVNYYC